MRRSICAFLILCGCDATQKDDAACEATLSVTPDVLALGSVEAFPQQHGEAVLIVENTSDCDATVGLRLEDEDGVFSLGTDRLAVPAHGSTPLTVQFAPTADQDSTGQILLQHGRTLVSVWLEGSGLAADLAVTTDPDAFEGVAVGCERTTSLTLSNNGRDDLLIDSIDLQGDDVIHLADDEVPWSLAPGESWTTSVTFSPRQDGPHKATLYVESNDRQQPAHEEVLAGHGRLAAEAVAHDLSAVPAPVDVLIVINGDTAADLVDAFVGTLPTLTGGLAESGVDFRLGVIVQDNGVVAGAVPYLSAENLDEQDAIIAEMLAGTVGSNSGALLQMAEQAVAANAWLRPEAVLHTIAVSDVADSSPDGWAAHLSAMQAASSDLVMHGFGGDYPAGCARADAFGGVYESVVATDGGFFSICSSSVQDHLRHVTALSTATPHALNLPEAAIGSSVVVSVDGEPYTGDLRAPDGDTITIDAQGLGADATFSVSYTPLSSCAE